MASLLDTLAEQLRAYSLLETTAVLAAVAYLVLAIRQNIWCWLCAGLSTAIYVYLFFGARLYMESVLNLFYFCMAIYGWWVWSAGRSDESDFPVSSWRWTVHLCALVAIFAVAVINGYLLERHSDAAFPYIDSMTTWGAIWATFLVARKVLENWYYWFVIDLASVYIYWSRELELTSVLFVVYVIMIPFGFLNWRRSMHEASA